MIWVRRGLTVPLGVILFVLMLGALIILQVSQTFMNPGFYIERLRKENIYEFILDDLATVALDDARELDPKRIAKDLDENPLVTSGLSTEEIVSSVNRAIPPAWVQAQVEQVLNQAGRYITGESDGFLITIQAGDQVTAVVSEAKTLARKADAYNIVFEEIVAPAVRDATSEDLPLGLDISDERLVDSVRKVASPDWMRAQVEAAIDEVTPYIIGEEDSFAIRVELADRVDMALEETKALLRESNAYDLLYDEVIEPAITDNIGEAVDLPFGISVTPQEVVDALRRVAPPEWVQEQAQAVIDEAGPYLAGREDSLRVSISIADNKREARNEILGIIADKLGSAADNPIVEAQIEQLVDSRILDAVPDRISFSDADLREALSSAGAEGNLDLLDDVREIVGEGWRFTDADLRRDLGSRFGPEAVDRLEDARAFLADGWVYTHEDLRADLAGIGDRGAVDSLDRSRSFFGWARTLKYLIYLPVAALVIGIGFLGGRRWPSRVAWAAASLAVVSAIILGASLATNNAVTEPRLQEIKQRVIDDIQFDSEFQNTQRIIIEKATEASESVAKDFASGLAIKSIPPLAIGIVALALALAWSTIRRVVPMPFLERL